MIFENFFRRLRFLKPDWLLQIYFVRFTLYLVKLHILFKLACHYSSYEKKIHFTRDKNPVLEVNYHLQPLKTYSNSRYVRKLGYVLNSQILNLKILINSSKSFETLARTWIKNSRTNRNDRNTCSWKEQEVGKSEVGKFLFKLERINWSWKEPREVGKFLLKLKSLAEVEKFRYSSKVDFFQVKFKFSNFISHYPTSVVLSHFSCTF